MASILGADPDEGETDQDIPLAPYIQALQRWKLWRDNVPLFYTTCVHSCLQVPSLSVQLYPHLRPDPLAPGLQRHAVLYGTQEDDVDVMVLASVAVDDPGAHAQLSRSSLQYGAASWEACRFRHTGDLDRLRYCSARPALVAVKCAGASLSLYDISPALELLERDGDSDGDREGGDDGGQLQQRNGQRKQEEGAEGGGGSRGPAHVMASGEQEGVSLAWGDGGGGDGLRLFSGVQGGGVGEYVVREDGSLAEVTVRRGGHVSSAAVVDVAWSSGGLEPAPDPAAAGPSTGGGGGGGAAAAPGLLASVGTDGRTLLWDPRQSQPALEAPRSRQDVNGVAFAPSGGGAAGGLLLAAAGDDGVVRVYDVRRLSCGGGGGSAVPALHRLKGHNCAVRQLSFSPHSGGLLASADEQGRVLLWELGRTTPLEEGLASRPQLVFTHAGHLLPVDDVGWSTELYGTLASVAGFLDPEVMEAVRVDPHAGTDLEGQPPAVLVWRPAADMIPPAP